MLKKATNWTYTCFFDKIFGLANLKHINSYNMRKKSAMTLYNFRNYFFLLGEVAASFLNLLSTAINNFITRKVVFLANKSLGIVR
jgi:hypothetical protein